MLTDLLSRLQLILENDSEAVKDFDHWRYRSEEKKLLRLEMELYKAERENELAEISKAMGALDYAEAIAESFAGGVDAADGEAE